jgi:hypothetical protein
MMAFGSALPLLTVMLYPQIPVSELASPPVNVKLYWCQWWSLVSVKVLLTEPHELPDRQISKLSVGVPVLLAPQLMPHESAHTLAVIEPEIGCIG